MHKLNRASVPIPRCLVSPGQERAYADLHGSEKEEVRRALLELQGDRCAYCERRTGVARDDGHIEHFVGQAKDRQRSLDWTNLFWSCNDEKTCGKHKDKCDFTSGAQARFRPEDILQPSTDDPEEFLLFVADGTIRARPELSKERQRRAEETVRVFQLAAPHLRKQREDAILPYVHILDALRAAGPQHFSAFVQRELGQLQARPFATAIKQLLESVSS